MHGITSLKNSQRVTRVQVKAQKHCSTGLILDPMVPSKQSQLQLVFNSQLSLLLLRKCEKKSQKTRTRSSFKKKKNVTQSPRSSALHRLLYTSSSHMETFPYYYFNNYYYHYYYTTQNPRPLRLKPLFLLLQWGPHSHQASLPRRPCHHHNQNAAVSNRRCYRHVKAELNRRRQRQQEEPDLQLREL